MADPEPIAITPALVPEASINIPLTIFNPPEVSKEALSVNNGMPYCSFVATVCLPTINITAPFLTFLTGPGNAPTDTSAEALT